MVPNYLGSEPPSAEGQTPSERPVGAEPAPDLPAGFAARIRTLLDTPVRLRFSLRTLLVAAAVAPAAAGLLGRAVYREARTVYEDLFVDAGLQHVRSSVRQKCAAAGLTDEDREPIEHLRAVGLVWDDLRELIAQSGGVEKALAHLGDDVLPRERSLVDDTGRIARRALEHARQDDDVLQVWKVVETARRTARCAGLDGEELGLANDQIRELLLLGARRCLARAVGLSEERTTHLQTMTANLRAVDELGLHWAWSDLPLTDTDLAGLGMTRADLDALVGTGRQPAKAPVRRGTDLASGPRVP